MRFKKSWMISKTCEIKNIENIKKDHNSDQGIIKTLKSAQMALGWVFIMRSCTVLKWDRNYAL